MVREATQQLKLSMTRVDSDTNLNEAAYSAASDWVKKEKSEVMLVSDKPEHLSKSCALLEIAERARIPAMYPFHDLVLAAGLMAHYRGSSGAFRFFSIGTRRCVAPVRAAARAACGQVAATPPRSVMNSRRCMTAPLSR